ncbi:hybrid sensor histidine kinase/response regulator transcription factor [Algibacter pacificus]|uniref:hybrid sensor histidine kinase/response regulator transcription factor n=1 Tax=Algibacter pacificus TaxID=2599389 RepID=UPI0011C7BCC5|nr:hybrid sensor histidine kinase/response regulator transcription factor [Algibacter pacificus]
MKKFLITFLFIYSYLGYSQEFNQEYLIDYISTNQGLSHNYVSQIVSDSLNFKWIASENGLIKFDGNSFTTIKPGPDYPGLHNENIETLFIDSKNNLWIGTKSGGLSRIVLETGALDNFNTLLTGNEKAALRVRSINEDSNGNIWVGTSENGLFVINNTYNELLEHYPFKQVLSIIKDAHGNIWFGSRNSLKKYDPSEDRIFSFNLDEALSVITDIVEDVKRNCLWISTLSNGVQKDKSIFQLDCTKLSIKKFNTGIETNYFPTLHLDNTNNLWIGTWGNGLYRHNEILQAFEKINLVYPPNEKNTVNYDIIINIHNDKDNVLWIATGLGGIVRLTEGKGFKNLDAVVQNSVLKENLVILSILKKEKFWLGTLRNGLFIGDALVNLNQVEAIGNKKVLSIYEDNSIFYVGTRDECYLLNASGQKISSIKIPLATSYLVENDEVIWVGTQQDGLILLDVSNPKKPVIRDQFTNNTEKKALRSNRITSLVRDNHNKLWVGTYNGIYMYDETNKEFNHHAEFFDEALPAIINVVFVNNGYIWLGTPDGLYKLKYINNTLKLIDKFSKKDGLKNDFICGITSYNNTLWLTTTTNLVQLNIKDKSFVEYGRNDGVYTSQFYIRSFYKDNASWIYAGGLGNLTYFQPDNIKKEIVANTDITLTHLYVNNEVVTPSNPKYEFVNLDKDFSYVEDIEFTHKEKSFAIGFASSNFANDVNNFRYKLEGYQDNWVNLKSQNEVHFVGLPPGTYKLHISSSKDLQQWSVPKSLNIKINYAPWLSPWAFFLYSILFALVITSFYYMLLKHSKLTNRLKKEQELSEAKFTFFTNISHEFRTPLTLITGPIKDMLSMEGLKTEVTEKLITVDKNATRLLNLINQLLDFRKAGHGLLKLNVSDGDFTRFTEEVFLYFKEQAVDKNIEYEYIKPKDSIVFPFDRNKIEIVLCNLISNAFKFTEKGGNIKILIDQIDDYCILKIKDNGAGMNKEFESKIFNRFYQIQTTNTSHFIGSGIGLSFTKKIVELHHGTIEVNSQLNKGTEFIIKFPLSINYNPSTIDENFKNTDKIEIYEKLDLNDLSIKNLEIEQKENTILIVEDNVEIREYVHQFLGPFYNILEAENGKQGVEIASKENCDLILCDIMMPIMDGLTACKTLKSNIITSHIPVILLTARSSNMYEIKGLKTGADDFITKPFDPQIVKARIATLLENRAKTRGYFLNKVRFEPTFSKLEKDDSESLFINKVIIAVEENLMNEDFGIENLIDICCMSQSTLYRKIKSLTGLSLTGFIRSIRIKKSAELILTEDLKMKQIAMQVGFNDYKYFKVSFKKQFGCVPSKYKSKIKLQNEQSV